MTSLDFEIRNLFQKHSLTKEEIKIFHRLKSARKNINLNNEEIIGCLITKKTYNKALELMGKFSELVTESHVGRIKLVKQHFESLSKGYLWSDPTVRGNDGEIVIFGSFSNYQKAMDTVSGDDIVEAGLMFFYRLFCKNPDSLRKGVIIYADYRNISSSKMLSSKSWKLRKRTSPMISKLPFRLKHFVMIEPPFYFSIILKIFKVFMSKKMSNRLEDIKVEDCGKFCSVENLPVEMGGRKTYDLIECLRKILVSNEEEELVFKEYINDVKKKKKLLNKKKKRARIKKMETISKKIEEEIEGEGES